MKYGQFSLHLNILKRLICDCTVYIHQTRYHTHITFPWPSCLCIDFFFVAASERMRNQLCGLRVPWNVSFRRQWSRRHVSISETPCSSLACGNERPRGRVVSPDSCHQTAADCSERERERERRPVLTFPINYTRLHTQNCLCTSSKLQTEIIHQLPSVESNIM